MNSNRPRLPTRRRTVLCLLALAAAAATLLAGSRLIPAVDRIGALPRPAAGPVLLAAAAISASYVCAAMGLRAAAGRPLPFQQTVLAQLAAALANRVVPAGVGGIAVNLRYLQRSGLPTPAATVAVATVTICNGVAGLVALLAALPAVGLATITGPIRPVVMLAAPAAAVVALAVLVARRWLPARARRWLAELRETAGALRHDPRRMGVVLACSLGVKIAHIAALIAALQAFDSELSPALVAAVYITGSAAAAAIPVPGGVGATEAVLVAGLVAVGGSTAVVLAGVLTFRLVSFWLPILPGAGATWLLRRRQMLS